MVDCTQNYFPMERERGYIMDRPRFEYEPKTILPGFWSIEEGGVRSFLVEGEHRAMLVDTGFGSGDLGTVVQQLTDKPVFVVNTHSDGDHVLANGQFDVIYMHPSEIARYLAAFPEASAPTAIWEGDIIDLGTYKFEVILTPGHTPGSICLLERARRLLLSGDFLQQRAVFLFGEGRCLTVYIAALERMIGMTGDFDLIYPSHGDFPAEADIVSKTLAGARLLRDGGLAVSEFEADAEFPQGLPAKLYKYQGISFLY